VVTQPLNTGYYKVSDSFTFHQQCSIIIPRQRLDRAFSLELSVEIVSDIGNDYFNYKSFPANAVFGFATIVFFDYVERLIPIRFGRNTLYFERNDAAYSLWEIFKFYNITKYDFYRETQVIGQLASNLGFTVTDTPYAQPEWKGFPLLPIRECYVKCPYGTVFRLEVTYEFAYPFYDMDENQILPESKRPADEKKDKGLPNHGTQPQHPSNPSDPYAGFPPASSPTDLGSYNNNGKETGVDAPNSDNQQIEQRNYHVTWKWHTLNESLVEITGSWAVDYVAGSPSDIVVSLGDFYIAAHGKDFYFMKITIAGVVVDNRAAGGNAAYEIFDVSITPV